MSEITLDHKSMVNAPVGVFDSGLGGLTVAREIMRLLPAEDIVYFGDTARVPYGSKSKDTILYFSRQIVRFLKTKNVKAIVVACNTASALALPTLREEIDIPIIGVVEPGAHAAAKATKTGHVGVIGTQATVSSGIYAKVIGEIDETISVIGKACPLFVPMVEEGLADHPMMMQMIDYYLSSIKESNVDALVLGCTHYPLLRGRIHEYLGDAITLVNPAYETAMGLKGLLGKHGLLRPEKSADETQKNQAAANLYVSDLPERFKEFANSILPVDIERVKTVNIEQF